MYFLREKKRPIETKIVLGILFLGSPDRSLVEKTYETLPFSKDPWPSDRETQSGFRSSCGQASLLCVVSRGTRSTEFSDYSSLGKTGGERERLFMFQETLRRIYTSTERILGARRGKGGREKDLVSDCASCLHLHTHKKHTVIKIFSPPPSPRQIVRRVN